MLKSVCRDLRTEQNIKGKNGDGCFGALEDQKTKTLKNTDCGSPPL